MSIVSGITLQFTLGEEQPDHTDRYVLVDQIDDWMRNAGFYPLTNVTEHYRGDKNPQIEVFGGGYNQFPEDRFAAFVMGLPWEFPDSCVLLIHPEHGGTRIWRADCGNKELQPAP